MYATENLSLLASREKNLKFRDHYNILYTSAVTKTKTMKATVNGFTIKLDMSYNEKNKSPCFFKYK